MISLWTIIEGAFLKHWLIWLRQTNPTETDTSETRGLPLGLIWLRHLEPDLHRYDWDGPNFFHRYFKACRSLKCAELKSENKIFWAPQSYPWKFGSRYLCHMTVNGKLDVSVISQQTLVSTSQSYQSQRYTSRLTHIGLIWVILMQSY